MPTVLTIILAVGGLLVAVASAPLVLYIMRRPKLRFVSEPIGFWSFLDAKELISWEYEENAEWIYFIVEMSVVNDGNEETHLTGAELEVPRYLPEHQVFTAELISTQKDGGRVKRNGGRLDQSLVFRMKNPPRYRERPHTEFHPHFYDGSEVSATLMVTPSQHRRLLWGIERVESPVLFVSRSVDEIKRRIEKEGAELPA